MGVLRRFFELLDDEGADLGEVLSPDLSFDLVIETGSIRGGRAELASHVASARSSGSWHHIMSSTEKDGIEFLIGEVRGGTEPATFLAAAEAGLDGKILRYLVTSSSVVRFLPNQ